MRLHSLDTILRGDIFSSFVQVHLWGEDELTGPITVEVEAPLGKPPVFYRRDSPWTELFVRIKDQFS